jgi:hypothetical protein
MKKLTTAFVAGLIVCSLLGCGPKQPLTPVSKDRIRDCLASKQLAATEIERAKIMVKGTAEMVELFHAQMNRYPTKDKGLMELIQPPADDDEKALWHGPYLTTSGIPVDPWSNKLRYALVDVATAGGGIVQVPHVWSAGPDRQDGTADDIRSWVEQPVQTQPAQTRPASQATVGHIIYVIDRSGSMMDSIDFLKDELKHSICRLKDSQDFHVIFFSEGTPIELPDKKLVPATEANFKRVAQFLDGIRAQGLTDPKAALRRAFEVLGKVDDKSGKLISLATDGDFCEDNDKVLALIKKFNPHKEVRINTIL